MFYNLILKDYARKKQALFFITFTVCFHPTDVITSDVLDEAKTVLVEEMSGFVKKNIKD